jgi:uncharacterized protein Usg
MLFFFLVFCWICAISDFFPELNSLVKNNQHELNGLHIVKILHLLLGSGNENETFQTLMVFMYFVIRYFFISGEPGC